MPAANASRVFYRSLVGSPPCAERAAGVYIYDSTGKAYLDASGGAAVSCLGHGDGRVIDAVKAQLDRLEFAHTGFFTNEPAERLADKLSHKAPGGAWRTYFLAGGSEATEAALKLARQIQVERGNASRDHFITRRQSYHGNTLGALSVGGRLANLSLHGPILLPAVAKIDPCYAYREQGDGESAEDYAMRAASLLEAEITRLGADRVIAFIAEIVVGATLGCVPPAPGYFREIRRICDAHGVLFIADEVMCGMGRCGTLFACEREGVVPDIITLGKGIGAGYQPLGAMMAREDIVAEIAERSGAFNHGHTYVGHPTACAAGLAVQEIFEQDGLVERCRRMGEVLATALGQRFADHPHIGDIRGRGLFRGLELVAERDTKAPFDPARRIAARIKQAAMDEGLICYPYAGTVDGTRGDHVLLAPPFIITENQIGELVDKLARAIDTAIA